MHIEFLKEVNVVLNQVNEIDIMLFGVSFSQIFNGPTKMGTNEYFVTGTVYHPG